MTLGAKLLVSTLLTLGSAAPASAPGVGSVSEPPRDRRRLEAIEMSAAGDAGVIRTVPEYLGEPGGAFGFGAPHCRGRTLGPATLEQLHVALRTGQLVTIATAPSDRDGKALPCIATVTFWAPSPGADP